MLCINLSSDDCGTALLFGQHVKNLNLCPRNEINIFWTPIYPKGSYVITPVRQSSIRSPWSVGPLIDISETALRIFLIFCMKLVHHKRTKVTEPDF